MAILAVMSLTAVLTATSASEPPNPGADVFAQTGYKRSPVTPADKKATNLPGPAAVWNGAAWWQVLTYCGTMHGIRKLRIQYDEGGTPEQLAEQDRLSEHYYDLAIERLATDRKISKDKVWDDFIQAEDAWWSYSWAGKPLNYNLEALTCRFAESRSKMS